MSSVARETVETPDFSVGHVLSILCGLTLAAGAAVVMGGWKGEKSSTTPVSPQRWEAEPTLPLSSKVQHVIYIVSSALDAESVERAEAETLMLEVDPAYSISRDHLTYSILDQSKLDKAKVIEQTLENIGPVAPAGENIRIVDLRGSARPFVTRLVLEDAGAIWSLKQMLIDLIAASAPEDQ